MIELILGLLLIATGVLLGVTALRLRHAHRRIAALESEPRPVRPPRALRTAGLVAKAAASAAVRVREEGVRPLLASSMSDFATWVIADRDKVSGLVDDDGTITVFFSDIERSTELNEELGDQAFVALLAKHDALVRTVVTKHGGHVVKTQGDGFMVVFTRASDAVDAALEIQSQLLGRKAGRWRSPVHVRIGLHTGEVIAKDGDFFGRTVAIAARVAGEAHGGQTLLSDDVWQRLEDDVYDLEPLYVTELKGLSGEYTIWQVT